MSGCDSVRDRIVIFYCGFLPVSIYLAEKRLLIYLITREPDNFGDYKDVGRRAKATAERVGSSRWSC
jgi:hypothetical protein